MKVLGFSQHTTTGEVTVAYLCDGKRLYHRPPEEWYQLVDNWDRTEKIPRFVREKTPPRLRRAPKILNKLMANLRMELKIGKAAGPRIDDYLPLDEYHRQWNEQALEELQQYFKDQHYQNYLRDEP